MSAQEDRSRERIAELERELAAARGQCASAIAEAAYWKRVVEACPEHISIFDDQWRYVYLNYAPADYPKADVRGRHLAEVVPVAYLASAEDAMRAAFESGLRTVYEARDDRHWYSNSVGPVEMPDGSRGVIIVSRNIDVLKKTESELRDARELWESLVTNSPDIIILCEPDSRVLFISRTLNNQSQEDVVGHFGTEFIAPEGRTAMLASIRRAADTRAPQVFEMQDTRLGRWWRSTLVPVRNSHRGDLVLSISQDITASKEIEAEIRRAKEELETRVVKRTAELDAANQRMREDITQLAEAERALRDSQERFRVIAETVPVAVVITRREDGRILFANRMVGVLLQTPTAEILGRRTREFYADPRQRDEMLARLASGQGIVDMELELVSTSGERLLVSSHFQATSFDGEAAILAGFVDITKRMEIEQQLRGERRLLKRLLELHERDRQLIAYEVHDGIVQDMTAALMFFEASQPENGGAEGPLSESFASGLKLLRGSIDEARRLIDGLRPPVLEDEGVLPAIETLAAELQKDSGIEIQFQSDVGFQRLAPALEMAIYRIVQEGLNNVWRHSRSPKASVSLVQHHDGVTITIQDWGIGFDPAKVSKRRYGLMGVRERARLLGGRAQIDSRPGEGTVVRVELPLIDTLMPGE
jgi:PAS domain S-box-containing protein